jgi:hypothetical protein
METLPRTFHDQFISVYQSAAEDVARRIQTRSLVSDPAGAERQIEHARALVNAAAEVSAQRLGDSRASPPGARGVERSILDTARTCARLGLQYLEARVHGNEADAVKIRNELQYGHCDPRWAETLEEYLVYFGPDGTRRQIPYVRPSQVGPQIFKIGPQSRIALVGDLGTGTETAMGLLRGVRQQQPDILIHLGDIYYSGTPQECELKFRQLVDGVFERDKTNMPVFTLAGNHDMYSGGAGYYDLLSKLNKPPMRQEASFFCLRSSDDAWQMLAMDTGLHDYNPLKATRVTTYLDPEEEAWHKECIRTFGGQTVLLSHHQLFSAFERVDAGNPDNSFSACNPALLKSYEGFVATGRPIAAWFWGHEHTLSIYQPYAGLHYGRCIGHGAIPVLVSDTPYEPVPKLRDPPKLVPKTKLSIDGDVYAHGFAMLTPLPKRSEMRVEYYQTKGGDSAVQTYSEIIGSGKTSERPSVISRLFRSLGFSGRANTSVL